MPLYYSIFLSLIIFTAYNDALFSFLVSLSGSKWPKTGFLVISLQSNCLNSLNVVAINFLQIFYTCFCTHLHKHTVCIRCQEISRLIRRIFFIFIMNCLCIDILQQEFPLVDTSILPMDASVFFLLCLLDATFASFSSFTTFMYSSYITSQLMYMS